MSAIKQTYLQRIKQRTHKAFTIIISTNKKTSIKIIDITLNKEITVILKLVHVGTMSCFAHAYIILEHNAPPALVLSPFELFKNSPAI